MTVQKLLISILTIFAVTTAHAANRCQSLLVTSEKEMPVRLKDQYPILWNSQPYIVKISLPGKGQEFSSDQKILVFNDKVAEFFKQFQINKNDSQKFKQSLQQLLTLLYSKKTFDFPVNEIGLVPAANNGGHHGGYGSYVWYRDLARVFSGVSALPEALSLSKVSSEKEKQDVYKMGSGLVKLFTEEEQIARTLRVILDPAVVNDPVDGYKNVIFIRQNLEARLSGKKLTPEDIAKESEWGHKQNDALALYAHALLDGIARGEIQASDQTLALKAELIYLTAYVVRINYAHMEDVGAWEELMGKRTSSISLVTSLLERINEGLNGVSSGNGKEKDFFNQLKNDVASGVIRSHLESVLGASSENAWNIIQDSLRGIPAAIAGAYEVIYRNLGISVSQSGKREYADVNEVKDGENARTHDAALYHILLYPPKGLTVQDQLHIIEKLNRNLLKESGIIRYTRDWFLEGNSNAIQNVSKLPFSPEMIAVKNENGYAPSTREDRDAIFKEYWYQQYMKNMDEIVRKNGSDLDARWSFHDSMLVQYYVKTYNKTKDLTFLRKAVFHMLRSLSWITGENNISIEGDKMTAFRAPEAVTKVRLIFEGQVFNIYLTSPNSPLNWTTAELITGIRDVMKALNENDVASKLQIDIK